MVDKAKNLAGIQDIIEPDAIQAAQHTDWSMAAIILLIAIAFLYLTYRWKTPVARARRRYKTIHKHQGIWSAEVIGMELKNILSDLSLAKEIPHEDIYNPYHQAYELCNQLRFSGVSQQPDTIQQALQAIQKVLWPDN
jgi:hypothetical protein